MAAVSASPIQGEPPWSRPSAYPPIQGTGGVHIPPCTHLARLDVPLQCARQLHAGGTHASSIFS